MDLKGISTQCTLNLPAKVCGVYKLTSPSGKVYVGSSKDIADRIKHYIYLDCKAQVKLYNSLKKYGFDGHKFEILEECPEEKLFERERYYGDLFNVVSVGLNLSLPGYGEVKAIYSEATRIKKSKGQTKEKNNFWGRKHKPETIEALKNKHLNRTPETIERMRLAQLGKKASAETRAKLSASSRGRKHSAETKLKMRYSSKKTKPVLNLETGIFYAGCKEAGEVYGINHRTLMNKLNGNKRNNTSFVYA